ncbi:Serine/threonine-protein phosphatase BSL1-like protein [Hibiscus syriacus]|uniref:Serine/threonine-protein phosphatase n=1 Tax=Hibiscus syriacus TaxID=106335 RepID=A0A6A2XQE3_HIBSY|nr:Serine/threonine-protein phosphatase BSL1-like protein [Hibiscus syriacus]
MGSKPWLYPAPTYRTLETYWDSDEDAPGPRCGHTLTAVAATKTHGPRLILFGGATAIEGGASSSAPGIRLAGVTNSVHSYDVLTRKWTRIRPAGEPPSPRAAHAAAAVGTMVVFQVRLVILPMTFTCLTNYKFKWHRVVVQGQGPGPRYGHVMDLVAQRYLVTVSGNDGKRVLSDSWALDTGQKPYVWLRLNPEGDKPCARMYATASARSDGMFLLCGGRDASGAPLSDAFGLLMHRNGQWEWTLAPGVSSSPRFLLAHGCMLLEVLRGGRAIEGEATVTVLDTAAGVWLDRNGLVTSSKNTKGHVEYDPLELMRRCRHASASVGVRIYIYGGLRGGKEMVVPENLSAFLSQMCNGSAPCSDNPQINQPNLSPFGTSPTSDDGQEFSSSASLSMDKNSMEKLREASAAEAEAANAVWLAAQAASAIPAEETSVSDDNSPAAETASDASDNEADVRLHPRAVVVAKETIGNLGGMVISTLLRPRNWKAPVNRRFFMDSYEVGELCYAAEQLFMQDPRRYYIEYPESVHLIRGNHEAADINALFGFRIECIERMVRRSIHSVEQIEKLERPITMDAGSIILMDLLWSDPTENDSIEGLRPNARGPGLVTFGPDRVTDFCKKNKLQLIIRAHECVMDGFERFAQGQLITLFSATNYCGTANNAGAILVVGRGTGYRPKINTSFATSHSVSGNIARACWRRHMDAGTEHPKTTNTNTWSSSTRPRPELTCVYMNTTLCIQGLKLCNLQSYDVEGRGRGRPPFLCARFDSYVNSNSKKCVSNQSVYPSLLEARVEDGSKCLLYAWLWS